MENLNEFLEQSVEDYRAKVGENVIPDINGLTVNLIVKLPIGASEPIVKAIAHTLAHVVAKTLNNDAPVSELPMFSFRTVAENEKIKNNRPLYSPHLDPNRNR